MKFLDRVRERLMPVDERVEFDRLLEEEAVLSFPTKWDRMAKHAKRAGE